MDTNTNAFLETEDPRYFGISAFNSGTACFATTAKFKKRNVGFGLPSAPAMFLNLALSFWKKAVSVNLDAEFISHPYPQGTYAEKHTTLFDYFESSTAHILLSFLAIESFANSRIPADFSMPESKLKKNSPKILTRDEVERYVSLENKLKVVLPAIENVSSIVTKQILWQSFQRHQTLRNRIVHMKTIDMKSSDRSVRTLWSDLLNLGKENFCNSSIEIIRHYLDESKAPRWSRLFPYCFDKDSN